MVRDVGQIFHLFQGSNVWRFDAQSFYAKEGLALKSRLATLWKSKQKRDVRYFGTTSMAEASPPEKVENLPMVQRENSVGGQSDEAGLLSASMFVDACFFRFLVGKGGITKQMLEKDTDVSLQIPSPKEAKQGKYLVIQGESQEALDNAMHQVNTIINQAIKSPQFQYSHFVSIPLALHPQLLESVKAFQKTVLEFDDESGMSNKGIDKSIFVKHTTFHLTLLMLKLWNEELVQNAADCLQKVTPRVHEALEGSPLTITLRGVDCMKGNPAKAHVLYADVEPNDQAGRLIKASQVITEAFTEAGLVMDKDQTQTLKLHATLMNTTQRAGGESGKRYKKRIPFDATEIMEKYKEHQWGEYHISEVHLSQRFVYDTNGYYRSCNSIPFPEIPSRALTPES
ncbi:uncharacterized protein [Physcomitrium patens]|uniref:K Homology domain-containing protein n=1 Tax=Physcomitrium patens TaxID=3218 RepID=A0A2K1J812_PHYPA|nr:activating signal cointegrator 1 complex subunit 1-like isoform X3 [Physcomitrium patens]PNR37658.1 hypothetical protein PHYPA_020767 [Physcomitrium patens]|eukprot:XP_024398767.1 activating signal cointegrator 1 complex subunit 1-like isoform X3 [Physcomitrella patens]